MTIKYMCDRCNKECKGYYGNNVYYPVFREMQQYFCLCNECTKEYIKLFEQFMKK